MRSAHEWGESGWRTLPGNWKLAKGGQGGNPGRGMMRLRRPFWQLRRGDGLPSGRRGGDRSAIRCVTTSLNSLAPGRDWL